jgi:4a-hydroxytetrahydrobiopterin dehydratase
MSQELAERHCKPCEGGVPPLAAEQAQELMSALHPDWQLSEDGLEIRRQFSFKAYSHTLSFANTVAWIATNEGHHPVLTIEYGSCDIVYTTHAINGLSDNDFICAAKIDRCAATVLGA